MRGRRPGRVRQRELRLGVRDAIGVRDRIMQRERSREVRLRRVDQRDRRPAGGRRRNREGGQRRAALEQGEFAVAVDDEATLARRAGGRLRRLRRRGRQSAFDARFDLPGVRAHDEHRILRRNDAFRLFLPGDLQQQRRFVGVSGRIDPRVDARRSGAGDRAAPIERGGDARVTLRSCEPAGGEREQYGGKSQRARIALGHAGRGRGQREAVEAPREPRPMQRPERVRRLVAHSVGELVVEVGGRPMRLLRIDVEARERLRARRPTQPRERRQRGCEGEREQREADDPRESRRCEPEPEPGRRQKQRDQRAAPGQRRPDALPDQRPSGATRQGVEPSGRA